MSEDDGHAWRPTPALCPHCGATTDDHLAANALPRVPHDGDYSLCLYCKQWGVFDLGSIRAPTPDEARAIATDPDCNRARFTLFIFEMQHGKPPKH